jgi:hypothetical protein
MRVGLTLALMACGSTGSEGSLPAPLDQYGVVTVADLGVDADEVLRVTGDFYAVDEPGWVPVDPIPESGCAPLVLAGAPLTRVSAGALTLGVRGEVRVNLPAAACADTDADCLADAGYFGEWQGTSPWREDLELHVEGSAYPAVRLDEAVRMPSERVRITAPVDGAELPLPFTVRWSAAADGTRAVVLVGSLDATGTLACVPEARTSMLIDEELLALLGTTITSVVVRVERRRQMDHTVAPGVGLTVRGTTADAVTVKPL